MPFGIDVNIGAGEGEVADFFGRLNKGLDKAPGLVDSAKRFAGKRSKPLVAGGTAAGAGMLYKKIRDAQKDRLNRDKLKSEKRYYDLLNEKLEKNAKLSDNAKQRILDTAAMTGAGMATIGGIKGASTLYDSLAEKLSNKEQKYWEDFIRRFPEYEDNKDAKDAFRLLLESSPNLAKHPIAVRTFVKRTLMTGSPNVDMGTLRDISSIESGFNRRTNSVDGQIVSGVDRIVRNAKDVIDQEKGG